MNDDLKKRIASLLRKAKDSGASEAEAMGAAEMAARLMAEAGVSAADVEFEGRSAMLRTRRPAVRDRLWAVVAICTNCAGLTARSWTPNIQYFGAEPGPEIAVYLTDVLNGAIDREIAIFKTTPEYSRRRTTKTRKAAVQDFSVGIVARLEKRLFDLFRAVISKAEFARAHAYLELKHPHTASFTLPSRNVRFGEAAAAGHAAGGKVTLAHGVNGTGKPLQIGSE